MLKFKRWDSTNPEHIQMARQLQNVIFFNEDGFVKQGYLYERYNHNGTYTYYIISNGQSDMRLWENTEFLPYEHEE